MNEYWGVVRIDQSMFFSATNDMINVEKTFPLVDAFDRVETSHLFFAERKTDLYDLIEQFF